MVAATDDPEVKRFTTTEKRVMAVVFIGMASTTFPMSVLSVSLPQIGQDLGMSPSTVTWVVTAPLLASAIATPILGKLGDLYGHRRVFISGFVAATVLSLATALAWSGPALIALRTLGQLCGAATAPSGMAILLTAVRRQDRLRVLSWWSLVAALAPSLGLVVGGPLIDTVGWRAVFVVQAIPAAICVVFAVRVLPATARRVKVSFDLLGALTLGLTLLALMFGLNRASVLGWSHGVVITSLALTPVFLALFVHVERRAAHPLLPLDVLANRNVSSALTSGALTMGPFQGASVIAPFLMVSQFDSGATAITAVALCRVLTFAIFGGLTGRSSKYLGVRGCATIGSAVVVAGLAVLAWSASSSSLVLLVAGMVLMGGGAGFAVPPFTVALTDAVDESHLGVASAAMNLSSQVGASILITTMSAVLTATGGTSGFAAAFAVGGVFAAISVFFTLRFEKPPVHGVEPGRELSANTV